MPSSIKQKEIKRLGIEDIDDMMRLHAACFKENWDATYFKACLEGAGMAWGIFSSSPRFLVGFVLAHIVVKEAEILTVCVDPSFQNKGYGFRLLKHFLALPFLETCFLEVPADNTFAQWLYEKCEFQKISIRNNYYVYEQGRPKDAIVYSFYKKKNNFKKNT